MLKAISIGIFAVGAVAAIVGAKVIYDEVKKRQDLDEWKKHKYVFVDEFWRLSDDIPFSSFKSDKPIADEVINDELADAKKRQDHDDGLDWDKVKEDRKKHNFVLFDEVCKLVGDIPSSSASFNHIRGYKSDKPIADEVINDEDTCFDDLSDAGKAFVSKFKNLNVCCVRTTSDEEAAEEELDGGEDAVPDDEPADATELEILKVDIATGKSVKGRVVTE